MEATELKNARLNKGWTQEQTALALGVTQAYLSMLEKGRREVPDRLVLKAQKLLNLRPTSLPFLPLQGPRGAKKLDLGAQLGSLGYPGFSYQGARAPHNPAVVLFTALNEPDLDSRVAEGLPWLALSYPEMDWEWLVRHVKVHDRQNRLGFTVSLARQLAEAKNDHRLVRTLQDREKKLETSRLAREDTFCHDSMTDAERNWLRHHRSSSARHWKLLTDLKGEHLVHAFTQTGS